MRDQTTSCYGMYSFQQEIVRFNAIKAIISMNIGMEI